MENLEVLTRPIAGYRYALLAFFFGLIFTLLAMPWVRKMAFKYGAVDDPKRDDRRVHQEPLPRWGGLGIAIGTLLAVVIVLPIAHGWNAFPPYLIGVLGVSVALVIVGALDDLYQFSARSQLYLLLIAGVLVQVLHDGNTRVQISQLGIPVLSNASVLIPSPWLAVPITAFYLFFVTKTMDTIDGVDGLAAGIAFISAATICVLATIGEQPRVAQISAAIGGASLGFLKHNYHPSNIIMGTGGAYLLGFLLACLSVVGAMKTAATVSLLVPILVFGVPLFDAFFVITKRLRSGVPITQADKRHVHHTLLRQGLNQRQTVWTLYTISALLSAILVYVVVRRNG